MGLFRLDHIDREILRIFETRARISNADLAPLIGLAPSTTRERVLRLERNGIILGYQVIVSRRSAGGGAFEGWADITLSSLPLSVHDAFIALIARSPDIEAAFQMSGAYEYLLHFVGADAEAWRSFCGALGSIGIGYDRIRFGVVVRRQKIKAALSGRHGLF